MKRHSFYKWFRSAAMLSSIPILAMMFATCKKYGVPDDKRIWGRVLDKETNEPIEDVDIQCHGNYHLRTMAAGEFEWLDNECTDLYLTKEGYQSKDTTLCPGTNHKIYLEKLPE